VETLSESKSVSLILNQSMKQPHAGYYYRYAASRASEKDDNV
jgi:hypothetical protein